MPARRRKQSNAMLYTLITFVGLFIVTTTIAVIYYVDAEDNRTRLADMQNQIDVLADSRERNALGTIVGTKARQKTWLGTMVEHLDGTASRIVGGVPETTSAEAKVNDVKTKVGNTLRSAQEHIDIADPNTTGLVQIIGYLTAELENTKKAKLATEEQLNDLQERFDSATKTNSEKEQAHLSEKNKLQQQVNQIQADYEDLQARLNKSTEDQIDTYRKQLEQATANIKTQNDELLKTQAELKMTEDMLKRAQQEVMDIKPPPDHEVLAQRPDGEIILIDDQAKVVHLNIGSNQHVYRGLTFTVYDRSGSIPKDGKGKAEIEVFDVADTYSAARITQSEPKRPILYGDIVANLIWNSDKTNVFVIAGDFDLDNDGNFDTNAIGRITALIEKWGGRVADTISIDTDFLLLGNQPLVPTQQPTFEERELDPGAMQRYEALLERLNYYNQLQSQAQALWIPIFRYERFLYFIGYKGQISQAGAF
jgi:predicted  nucleic acid-binding Zn-ribbon protein